MAKSTPQSVIQLIFDKNDQDQDKSVAAVIARARTSESLREYLIDLGAKAAIGAMIRSENAKISRQDPEADVTKPRMYLVEPGDTSHKLRARYAGRAKRELADWLNYVLPNRVKLRNATQADLDHAIAHYGTQANSMLVKTQLFRAVRAALPKGKRVGDVLDNRGIYLLQEGLPPMPPMGGAPTQPATRH